VDGAGVNFFFNTKDGTSSWDHPLDFYFRNLLKESLAAPATVHSDAGNAGANMSLTDVAAAGGCDIIAPFASTHGGSRTAGAKRGVDTSAGQMLAYARHLGMNLTQDLDLLWIAEQALNAPTPAGWKEHMSAEDGTVYYSNQETGLKTYSHPLDDHFRELYKRLREVKLLSSKEVRKASAAGATQKPPPLVNLAVKVIESLNVIEEDTEGREAEEQMNLEAQQRSEEEEGKKRRTFGTELELKLSANVAANQPAVVAAAAAKKDAPDAEKLGSFGLPADAEGVGFKEKAAPTRREKENNVLDHRERCVIPAAKKRDSAAAADEKLGPFGLPADAEGVGFQEEKAAAPGRQEKENRLDHRERCVIPAAKSVSAPEAAAEEMTNEVDAEAEELAEVMRLSAEEADRARLEREAEDKDEDKALEEALKLSADLAEAMKVSVATAAVERVRFEAEEAAEAEVIKLSMEEAETRMQQDAFALEEEQRAIARAALESAIAEEKAVAARRAEEEKLEAERTEKARVAAAEAEKARVAAERENAARLALEAKEAALEAEAMKLSADEAEAVRAALETEAAQEAQAIKLSMEEAAAVRQRDAFAFEEYQTAMSKAVQASAIAEQKAEAAREAEETRAKAEEEEKARGIAEEAERVRVAAEAAEKARVVAAEAERVRVAAEKANDARRARRALEVAEAEAEAEAIKLSISEANFHAKLFEEEQSALTHATTASLDLQKAANDKKAQELVSSLLFAGFV
jgi:hypothetical protein